MLIESDILHRDKRVFEHVGNVFDIRPVAVFHIRNRADEVSVHVVKIARVIRNRQLRHVQRRRRFDIRLHHAKQKPHADKANDNKRQHRELERRKHDAEQKRVRLFPLRKERLVFFLLVCVARLVFLRLQPKERIVFCHQLFHLI